MRLYVDAGPSTVDIIDGDTGELKYQLAGPGALGAAHDAVSAAPRGHVYFDTWVLGPALDANGARVLWSDLPLMLEDRHLAADYDCPYWAQVMNAVKLKGVRP